MASASGKPRPALSLIDRSDSPAPTADATPPRDDDSLDWSILMAHAQRGDRAAYRRLLAEIAPYVRSLAMRCQRNACDVEDCVQDVLLTVHAVRHTYDPMRPFAPWLVAIAHRRIADRLRRQHRSTLREVPFTDEHESQLQDAASGADEAASDARAVREAIGRLPVAQREAMRLLKLQELSLREAASMSGMSIGALKIATHRAMKSLRRMLGTGDER